MTRLRMLSDEIERYAVAVSGKPSPLCEELFAYTEKNVPWSGMLIGPLAGGFLTFLIRLIRARRVLEIGTYTGYSALAMAEALPEDGELITLDVNSTAIAREFWDRSEHGRKIRAIRGPAAMTMEGLQGRFDLILIDADKEGYLDYLKRSLELLNDGGLIALDNALQEGRVLDPGDRSPNVTGIRRMTEYVTSRQDLVGWLAPIRDGIFLVQKAQAGRVAAAR